MSNPRWEGAPWRGPNEKNFPVAPGSFPDNRVGAMKALLAVFAVLIATPGFAATPPVTAGSGARPEVTSETFLDEDARPWRETMRARFEPLIRDCKTRREAILVIAKNAERVCGVRYSTERRAANQSVAESLESGKASCTGLSILLAAAYRSTGIPARIAGVARWGDRPGNHTWVEVLDDDGWHFVEYYPDKDGLDHGWILDPILRLTPDDPFSRVLARDDSGDKIFRLPWAPENTSLRAVDRTDAYRKLALAQRVPPKADASTDDAGTLFFEARDAAGKRVALDFRVMAGNDEACSGKTPGPLDDLNNMPRANLPVGREVTLEYKDKSGKVRRIALTPKKGEPATVTMPAG